MLLKFIKYFQKIFINIYIFFVLLLLYIRLYILNFKKPPESSYNVDERLLPYVTKIRIANSYKEKRTKFVTPEDSKWTPDMNYTQRFMDALESNRQERDFIVTFSYEDISEIEAEDKEIAYSYVIRTLFKNTVKCLKFFFSKFIFFFDKEFEVTPLLSLNLILQVIFYKIVFF